MDTLKFVRVSKENSKNTKINRTSLDSDDHFYISMTPVTVNQYCSYLNTKKYHYRSNFPNFMCNLNHIECQIHFNRGVWKAKRNVDEHPITGVTLYGAYSYAKDNGLILPTLSHWNRICNIEGIINNARWQENLYIECNISDSKGGTTSVYEGPISNNLKVYNLIGNVASWCIPVEKEYNLSELRTSSFPVVGCGWNKGIYDTNKLWMKKRWGRTGSVSTGFRCVLCSK
jgi:formylglycine-generating enzyme required for sulfatase activity